ncbi:hypothetical protein [Treponema sp. C6A8]|uniref:hypothetical protein n=1 Tax=Treponema sp. C6A8 TaxID=1410609 RepID=UPI000487F119|nr:hypothetical protein [Treponema sp. C6A8]
MKFPIIFPHYRTGDRDSIYDYDLSIAQQDKQLIFTSVIIENNGNGEYSNIYTHFKELRLKEDFFQNYSKEEFLNVLKFLTDVEFKIPGTLKFNKKGTTTIWKNYRDINELKAKEYFISWKES